MPKTNKNAPEKWGANKKESYSHDEVEAIVNNITASNKPILGNKEKKIVFLSFYSKNKGNINMKAYADSIGVNRTTLYNWIKGK
jgi:hypothetical protein